MASKTLLAIALVIESCVGMDDFFMPLQLTAPKTFPLDPAVDFSFRLEAKTTPTQVPTLKYVLKERRMNNPSEYLIWIQNYHLASVQACQKAIAHAIREMANNRTLRMSQLDATKFI